MNRFSPEPFLIPGTMTPVDALDLAIEDVVVSRSDLSGCLGAEDPEAAARRLAGAVFDGRNASAYAAARTRLQTMTDRRAAAVRRLQGLEDILLGVQKRHAKTRTVPDPQFRPSIGERVSLVAFGAARLALLGAGVLIIALYARASGVSVDISTNWFLALSYGTPVVLASYVLSSLMHATDQIETRRRIAVGTTLAGVAFLLCWLIATAAMFALETDTSTLFATGLGLGATEGPAAGGWFGALFPQNMTGRMLLLMHVLTDVVLGAAAGCWMKLVGCAGREMVFAPRPEEAGYREAARHQVGELEQIDMVFAHLSALVETYPLKRALAADLAATTAAGMLVELKAARAAADRDMLVRLAWAPSPPAASATSASTS